MQLSSLIATGLMLWGSALGSLLPNSSFSSSLQAFTAFDWRNPPSQSSLLLACAQKSLSGNNATDRIIQPSDARYNESSSGVILVPQFPALIVYAVSAQEVTNLVRCGVTLGYTPTPRSGGHSFENWSALNGTLVIDISHLNYVNVAQDLNSVTVGGGSRLGAMYTALSERGKTVMAGICPSVGIGGYIGVGGYNMQQRAYGPAVDHLLSAKVVLGDGSLITVSSSSHPDLWFAIRGGGFYGIIVEATFSTTTLPRSAMIAATFPNASTRADVVTKYLNWGPSTDPLFNGQINLYSSYSSLVGWYLGKSVSDLQALVAQSGLDKIPGAQIKITGNCSTENSRVFWLYQIDECIPDDQAHEAFLEWFNVPADDIAPIAGDADLGFVKVAASPNETMATPWPRASIINKTYFQTKQRPLTADEIAYVMEISGVLPAELGFWTEITSFNLSSAPATTSAVYWSEDVTALWRFEVSQSTNATLQALAIDFMKQLDSYLIPRIGNSSYAGYVDYDISVDPFTAYYGGNVCKLVDVKKKYDPLNIFKNPFSIPTKAPAGHAC